MKFLYEKPAEPVYYNKDWGFSSASSESRAFREGRRERKREKMQSELGRVYRRLMSYDNGDDYIDTVFDYIGLSGALRAEYKRTHRVVGPGATVARDFVSVWVSPADARSPKQRRDMVDYSKEVNHTLENFLKETWYRDTCGHDAVDDVAELAIGQPHVAAKQAQAVLRRRGFKKANVVCAEFTRSKNVCARTIASFSENFGDYGDQIRCYIDGNWMQLVGPNGLGDWEIAAHISQAVAARDLFNVIAKIGYEFALLLLDNEVSVLNIFVSKGVNRVTDSSDYGYEPYCNNSGSLGEKLSSGSCSFGTATAAHDEAILSLDPGFRSRLEDLSRCVSTLTTDSGLGHKVHVGANTAITVKHLIKVDDPSHKATELDNGAVALVENTGGKPAWRFRNPLEGEPCYVYHIVNKKPILSELIWVVSVDSVGGLLKTSRPIGIKKGDSGSALVSAIDLSLLGFLQGASDSRKDRLVFSVMDVDKFWALAISNLEINLNIPVLDAFAEVGLKDKLLDVVRSLNYGTDSVTYLKTGPGWLYKLDSRVIACGAEEMGGYGCYVTASMSVLRYQFPKGYLYVDNVTWRMPKLSEKVIGLTRSDDRASWVVIGPFNVKVLEPHNDLAYLEAVHDYSRKDTVIIVSTVDCALLGFCYPDSPSMLCTLTSGFSFSKDDIVFPPKFLGFIGADTRLRCTTTQYPAQFIDVWSEIRDPTCDLQGALSRLKLALVGRLVFEVVPWSKVLAGVSMFATGSTSEESYLVDCLARLFLFYEDYGELPLFLDRLVEASLGVLIS